LVVDTNAYFAALHVVVVFAARIAAVGTEFAAMVSVALRIDFETSVVADADAAAGEENHLAGYDDSIIPVLDIADFVVSGGDCLVFVVALLATYVGSAAAYNSPVWFGHKLLDLAVNGVLADSVVGAVFVVVAAAAADGTKT
jgi:hypothetical protein